MADPAPARAFLAFGSNLGDSRALVARAIAMLTETPDIRLLARSSDYHAPPWGKTDQPAFINACIVAETTLGPHALLGRAHAIERALGRDRAREIRWGPRTDDIDIIAVDGVTMNAPDLTLPHPRLFERAFVLLPLAEIAPDLVIAGRRIGDAAARIDAAGIEKLPPS
jgi:2-amino-4-hydroxy-6-hydroxymethyldihydropteridine diphosphokinase